MALWMASARTRVTETTRAALLACASAMPWGTRDGPCGLWRETHTTPHPRLPRPPQGKGYRDAMTVPVGRAVVAGVGGKTLLGDNHSFKPQQWGLERVLVGAYATRQGGTNVQGG